MSNYTRLAALAALVVAMPATARAGESWVPQFTANKRAVARSADRYGDLPLGAVIRTDERYGSDPIFQGPRGWDYWNLLENPKPYQDPNLWPDKRPTYLMAQLALPPGLDLAIRGKFPHARYFKLALYRFEHNTFIAIRGEDISAWDIEPDPGSANPYGVGADRAVENRNFTLHILATDPPPNRAERAKNTVYAGSRVTEIQAVFRVYLSDEGYDGLGLAPADSPSALGPAFTYEATLADGTRVSAENIAKDYARPLGSAPPPMDVEKWYALVNSKDNDPSLNPASAPARKDSQFEIFYGIKYNVVGVFWTPEKQAQIKLQTEMEGGGDPATAYMVNYISRKFGAIYVFRAKMPTFPDTYKGARTMPAGQVKYWSVATMAAAPSGELWDGVSDMMVPLDDQGFYTIVVSRPEDRPKNATAENGVAWIDWGPGEGIDDPRDRKDWGMLLMRFMNGAPDWANNPGKATKPGTAEAVMGPFFPKGYYTTKEQFEAEGPKK